MLWINRICILILLVYCMHEVSSRRPEKATFRCTNGRYLWDRWFCDGRAECDDQIDERLGCDNATCGRGKFKCDDGKCLDINARCDTIKNCPDGSDEWNCGDEIEVDDCSPDNDKFLCSNKLRCIDFNRTCDHECNCADCSDENIGCPIYENMLCSKCSGSCYTNTSISQTFGLPSSHWTNTVPCKVCEYSTFCTQKCYVIGNSFERCICDENYRPVKQEEDEYRYDTCVNDVPYENVLIYSTVNEIKLFNLTTNETQVLRSEVNCTALSAAHDNVFYAHLQNSISSIMKTSITSRLTTILYTSNEPVTSISVDWMTNNIYYTTRSSISVWSNHAEKSYTLKLCSDCRVKVAPKMGLMFWSTNYTLMNSAMDGSNEEKFRSVKVADDSKLAEKGTFNHHQAVLFTVDESKESVFFTQLLSFANVVMEWSNMFKRIETDYLRFNSRVKEYAIYGQSGKYLQDLAELDGEIYMTVENSSAILAYSTNSTVLFDRLVRENGNGAKRLIDHNTTVIRNVFAYNRLLQRTKISNPCKTSSCSSLCLLRPWKERLTLSYTCVYTNGTRYSPDLPPDLPSDAHRLANRSDPRNFVFLFIFCLLMNRVV